MTDPIVSRAHMRMLGREAFQAGKSRDSHYMNWHAAALVDWHTGYDQAAAEAQARANDMRHDQKRWPRATA